MRKAWYFDPRFLAFVGHTVLIGALALSVALMLATPSPFFGTLFPLLMALIGLLDLPVLGIGLILERWVVPGHANDFRVFALELAVFGGLQWVVITEVFLRLTGRKQPLDPNACRRCKYDLTGNVSGVCPECGTPR